MFKDKNKRMDVITDVLGKIKDPDLNFEELMN